MTRHADPVEQLVRSWNENAAAWTSVVRGRGIESRRLVTDAAVVDAVTRLSPARVLDLGCGEGWLCRALSALGIQVMGVDGSSALVAAGRASGASDIRHVGYEQLADDPQCLDCAGFDVVVCNFSLLQQDVVPLLRGLRSIMTFDGRLVIQTVHPCAVGEDAAHGDGWRIERFSDFGETFPAPMPWYFRTPGSWIRVLAQAGFGTGQLHETVHPVTETPLSLLCLACPNP